MAGSPNFENWKKKTHYNLHNKQAASKTWLTESKK